MKNSSSTIAEFSRLAGELAESLNLNKSVGQIYALLYITGESLSLEEIAARLKMSKGNVSINLRALEYWGAVRFMSKAGTRKDYYEANQDLKEIILRRVQEGMTRRMDMAEGALSHVLSSMEQDGVHDASRKRIEDLQAMITKGRKALALLPKVAGFL